MSKSTKKPQTAREAAERYVRQRHIPGLPKDHQDIYLCANDFMAGVRWARRQKEKPRC